MCFIELKCIRSDKWQPTLDTNAVTCGAYLCDWEIINRIFIDHTQLNYQVNEECEELLTKNSKVRLRGQRFANKR